MDDDNDDADDADDDDDDDDDDLDNLLNSDYDSDSPTTMPDMLDSSDIG